MKLIFFFIFFTIFERHCLRIEKIKSIDDCGKERNWWNYRKHFSYVKSLTLTVLQSDDEKYKIKTFTEHLIDGLNDGSHDFTIEQRFLHKYNTIDKNFDISDVGGYVIIAGSIHSLNKFLKTDFGVVIRQRRGIYAVFLLFQKNCSTLDIDVHGILNTLWLEYGLLCIIAEAPCSCEHNAYIHFPFFQANSSWGFTKKVATKEAFISYPLIKQWLYNFNRFPIKVSLFVRIPNVMQNVPEGILSNPIYSNLSSSKGYVGIDAFLLGVLASSLNFKPIIVPNHEIEKFGRVLKNGTITGSLADIVNRKAHISVNSRFLKNYYTRDIEFTVPYDADKFCMLVPKATKIPIWKTLFLCFDVTSWFVIFLSFLVSIMFWFKISKRNISKTIWECFAYFTGMPVKVVPTVAQSWFLVSCFMFSIIILGIIQGSFFTYYTTPVFYKDIDTLQELCQSNLPIATNYWYLVEDDESDLMRQLKKRVVPTRGRTTYDRIANGEVATWGRKRDIEAIIKSKYTNKNGVPLLHVVRECHTSFLLSGIVPKGSPFLIPFNEVIRRLVEGGFPSKWYNDVSYGLLTKTIKANKFTKISPRSIDDMQAAFRVLLLGHCCSVVIFVIEIVLKVYKSN